MFLKSGIGRRLLSIFFVVAVATILSFFILHMSPVDPVSLAAKVGHAAQF
nr:hypothetical protein [Dialister invisus]